MLSPFPRRTLDHHHLSVSLSTVAFLPLSSHDTTSTVLILLFQVAFLFILWSAMFRDVVMLPLDPLPSTRSIRLISAPLLSPFSPFLLPEHALSESATTYLCHAAEHPIPRSVCDICTMVYLICIS